MLATEPITDASEDGYTKHSAADADTQPPPTADTERFRDTRTGFTDSANATDTAWHMPDLKEMPQAFITGTDLEQEVHSARTKDILSEAELRAEHQALARNTMLDLVQHIEDLGIKRRELEKQLLQEQKVSAGLRLEVKGVEKQRDNFQQKEAKLQQRWFKELLPRSDLMKTCAAVLTQNQGHPLQIMNPSLKATDPRPVPNKMDYMEVQPYLAEWLKVARGEREAREKDQRLITLRKEMEEEKKKALEAKDKELAHERSISQNLDASLKKVQSEVSLMEARIQTMENENKRLRSEAVAAEANFQKVLAEKKEELEQVLKQIVEKDREIVTLKQESIEIAERARLEKETLQMEIQKVKAQMRDVEMQLSQTVNALKQMKDSTLRAKREASGGVSPDKFALLIADLEEMRDRLAILTRESELERNTASWLKAKLGQNRRALELERQFLPLLHKVRGPVGPKSTMLEKKSSEEQRPATSLPAAGSKPLGNSLSAGSLGGRGSMA